MALDLLGLDNSCKSNIPVPNTIRVALVADVLISTSPD